MKQEIHITLLFNLAIGNVGLFMMSSPSLAVPADWVGHKVYAQKHNSSHPVKAQPAEESRLVHRFDDRHHPKDKENRLPVFIVEEILRGENKEEGENGSEDRGNRPAYLLGNDQSIGKNENSKSNPLLRRHIH